MPPGGGTVPNVAGEAVVGDAAGTSPGLSVAADVLVPGGVTSRLDVSVGPAVASFPSPAGLLGGSSGMRETLVVGTTGVWVPGGSQFGGGYGAKGGLAAAAAAGGGLGLLARGEGQAPPVEAPIGMSRPWNPATQSPPRPPEQQGRGPGATKEVRQTETAIDAARSPAAAAKSPGGGLKSAGGANRGWMDTAAATANAAQQQISGAAESRARTGQYTPSDADAPFLSGGDLRSFFAEDPVARVQGDVSGTRGTGGVTGSAAAVRGMTGSTSGSDPAGQIEARRWAERIQGAQQATKAPQGSSGATPEASGVTASAASDSGLAPTDTPSDAGTAADAASGADDGAAPPSPPAGSPPVPPEPSPLARLAATRPMARLPGLSRFDPPRPLPYAEDGPVPDALIPEGTAGASAFAGPGDASPDEAASSYRARAQGTESQSRSAQDRMASGLGSDPTAAATAAPGFGLGGAPFGVLVPGAVARRGAAPTRRPFAAPDDPSQPFQVPLAGVGTSSAPPSPPRPIDAPAPAVAALGPDSREPYDLPDVVADAARTRPSTRIFARREDPAGRGPDAARFGRGLMARDASAPTQDVAPGPAGEVPADVVRPEWTARSVPFAQPTTGRPQLDAWFQRMPNAFAPNSPDAALFAGSGIGTTAAATGTAELVPPESRIDPIARGVLGPALARSMAAAASGPGSTGATTSLPTTLAGLDELLAGGRAVATAPGTASLRPGPSSASSVPLRGLAGVPRPGRVPAARVTFGSSAGLLGLGEATPYAPVLRAVAGAPVSSSAAAAAPPVRVTLGRGAGYSAARRPTSGLRAVPRGRSRLPAPFVVSVSGVGPGDAFGGLTSAVSPAASLGTASLGLPASAQIPFSGRAAAPAPASQLPLDEFLDRFGLHPPRPANAPVFVRPEGAAPASAGAFGGLTQTPARRRTRTPFADPASRVPFGAAPSVENLVANAGLGTSGATLVPGGALAAPSAPGAPGLGASSGSASEGFFTDEARARLSGDPMQAFPDAGRGKAAPDVLSGPDGGNRADLNFQIGAATVAGGGRFSRDAFADIHGIEALVATVGIIYGSIMDPSLPDAQFQKDFARGQIALLADGLYRSALAYWQGHGKKGPKPKRSDRDFQADAEWLFWEVLVNGRLPPKKKPKKGVRCPPGCCPIDTPPPPTAGRLTRADFHVEAAGAGASPTFVRTDAALGGGTSFPGPLVEPSWARGDVFAPGGGAGSFVLAPGDWLDANDVGRQVHASPQDPSRPPAPVDPKPKKPRRRRGAWDSAEWSDEYNAYVLVYMGITIIGSKRFIFMVVTALWKILDAERRGSFPPNLRHLDEILDVLASSSRRGFDPPRIRLFIVQTDASGDYARWDEEPARQTPRKGADDRDSDRTASERNGVRRSATESRYDPRTRRLTSGTLTILWNPDDDKVASSADRFGDQYQPPWVTLAHEFSHARDWLREDRRQSQYRTIDSAFLSQEHRRAMRYTNYLRENAGLEPMVFRSGDQGAAQEGAFAYEPGGWMGTKDGEVLPHTEQAASEPTAPSPTPEDAARSNWHEKDLGSFDEAATDARRARDGVKEKERADFEYERP